MYSESNISIYKNGERAREASQLSLQLVRQLVDGEGWVWGGEGGTLECQSSALNDVLNAQQLNI